LRRIWLGATIPAAIVAMMRRMSGQLRSMSGSLILPPTSARTLAGVALGVKA
jgi:hypothetical protein